MKLDARKIVFIAVCYHTKDDEKPYSSYIRAALKIDDNTYKCITTGEIVTFDYTHKKPFIILSQIIPFAHISPKSGFQVTISELEKIEQRYYKESPDCKNINDYINTMEFYNLIENNFNVLKAHENKAGKDKAEKENSI